MAKSFIDWSFIVNLILFKNLLIKFSIIIIITIIIIIIIQMFF